MRSMEWSFSNPKTMVIAKNPRKKSRVLLINPNFPSDAIRIFGEGDRLFAPMGLLLVASVFEKAGYEVCLIDPQLMSNPMDAVAEEVKRGVLFVGITVFQGPNVLRAREISFLVKKLSPETPVVWGGPLPTSAPDICFRDAPVDFIVMGMGEETALELARCIETGQDPATLPHISAMTEGKINNKEIYCFTGELDDLLYPDMELWGEGVRRLKSIPILTSRGCPRNCAFCYNNTFTGKKRWLANSEEYVLQQMERWSSHFGFSTFYFVDDNFLVDTRRAYRILKESLSRGWNIRHLAGHVYDFKPQILELIEGHIDNVGFAIESASPKIQRLINKYVSLDLVLDLIRSLMAGKVNVITVNFMLGFPYETDDDIAANINAACRIRDLNPEVRSIPSIYAPQPKDDIIPKFSFPEREMFSLETLSSDMASHRSGFLEPKLRPWMKEEDMCFYIDLLRVWFHYFDCKVRASVSFDVNTILDGNKRLAGLFANVSPP